MPDDDLIPVYVRTRTYGGRDWLLVVLWLVLFVGLCWMTAW